MKMQKVACAVLAACSLALAGNANALNLRIGHSLIEDSSDHKAFVAFGEKLKELSGGDIEVTIFPNSTLGGEREMAEQVLNGALDICRVGGQVVESFYQPYAVLNTPYLFRDFDHVKKFIKSEAAHKYLLDATSDLGFVGLWFETAGPRSFYTKVKIEKPEDLKGLKMRVPEAQMSLDTVKYLGGQPTPLSSSEVYSALQQSVIDGAENNFVFYCQSRQFEVAPYFNEDEHSMPPNVVIMSQYVLDELSDQEKAWIKEASDYARDVQMQLYDEEVATYTAQIDKLGIKYIKVDKAPFVEKTRPILESQMQDPKKAEIINAITAIK